MMTTADAAGLLRDVLEHPGEDGPRLVYADWLEDAGQPLRALFIRAQFDVSLLVTLPPMALSNDRTNWFGPDWPKLPPLPAPAPRPRLHTTWRRGFMDEIHLSTADFLAHAEAMFRAQPIVAVTLTDREPARNATEHGTIYSWYPSKYWTGDGNRPYYVPKEFGLLLQRNRFVRTYYPVAICYDTASNAREDLSRACVAHGRQKAALPPLPAPAV